MSISKSIRRILPLLTVLMIVAVLGSSVFGQDTLLISYQGRLTDDTGEPITGTPAMTFTIYNGAGVSKWSEVHPTVQVDDGLFNVILGSQTALPDSVFTGEDRHLGITVGSDPEISPRTLFTCAAAAAYARSIKGDIETGESSLVIKNSSGDSTIVVDAGSDKGSPRMTFSIPIDPHYPALELASASWENSVKVGFSQPPDPYEPAVELSSNEAGSNVKVNWSMPPDPVREAITLSANNSGNTFTINCSWPPDPIQPAFEVFSDAVNEEVSMRLGQPPDPMTPEFEVTATSMVTSLRLGQPPDPIAPGIELLASVESGPSVNVYDEIGQIMSVDPSPFNEGIAIKLMEPVDGGSLLEVSSNHITDEASIRFMEPGDDKEILTMSTGPSTGASIKMFNPQPEPPALVMEMDVSESGGNWESYFNMYSTEPLDNNAKTLEISNIGATGANLKLFNAQPGKASTTAIDMYYDSLNGGGAVFCGSDHDGSHSYITGRDLYLGTDLGPGVYMHYGGAGYFAANLGVGVIATNILEVQQDSPTDPIADAWTVYSSRRWKKNIEPIEGALEKVEQLRGVSFDWKSTDKHDIGMIAEEVGEVIPEVVAYEENGRDAKSIDYGRMAALLVEAVKELKEENKDLRSRIEELEGR